MTTTDTQAQAPQELLFDVVGMHCNGCANTIRAGAAAVPGVADASVDLKSETLKVMTDGAIDSAALKAAVAAAVAGAGYAVKEEEDWS